MDRRQIEDVEAHRRDVDVSLGSEIDPRGAPGGDVIGRRRVDTHFLALEQLGASLTVGDRYELEGKHLTGADIFLGLSAGNVLTPAMVETMVERPVIFALANPTPEILPDEVRAVRDDAVIGVDITPSYPIRLSGYAARKTESEGVEQRLWAKALAIGDPDSSASESTYSLPKTASPSWGIRV